MNKIIKPDKKNNKTKTKLLITQRNQGIEGSRAKLVFSSSLCGPEAAVTSLVVWVGQLELVPH